MGLITRVDQGAGVGLAESLAASAAVLGIPFMIQRVNTTMISGERWPFGGMARINVCDGLFGSGMGCPWMTCNR